MNLRHALPLALACLASAPGVAAAADVPAGAVWTEATIPSTDGVQLHADILRPKRALHAIRAGAPAQRALRAAHARRRRDAPAVVLRR